jgi:hypothetical protein
MTVEALADVAKALGWKLIVRTGIALPIGIDADDAALKVQYALVRDGEIEFDGTARECSAFLIGWRDLRSKVLGGVRAMDAQVMPEMSGRTRCRAPDPSDPTGERCCLAAAGHEDSPHTALVCWSTAKVEVA